MINEIWYVGEDVTGPLRSCWYDGDEKEIRMKKRKDMRKEW